MRQLLENNLNWFYRSGVMIPENGLWGIAERVALTRNNSALERTLEAFPAWTCHEEYCIIEQRRPDCNFQAAFLFLLSHRIFGDAKYYETAVNILDFLYFRSGLLWRRQDKYVPGSWNWSHIKRESVVWYDDESWCVFLALEIARLYPELDKKYDMKHYALMLAGEMAKALEEGMISGIQDPRPEYEGHWPMKNFVGCADMPHWGSLACMALARAYKEEPRAEFEKVVSDYHAYLDSCSERFNASEASYALIGANAAYTYIKKETFRNTAACFAKILIGKMGESGNIPSEHFEAPCGENLIDTIYTVNWALLGLFSARKFLSGCDEPFKKILELVCRIQDTSAEPWLNGCWRGMFDTESGTWGGGDCYEGGACSIYTGWTNAPISIILALVILNETLFTAN